MVDGRVGRGVFGVLREDSEVLFPRHEVAGHVKKPPE